jgi:hypothetical protein
MIYVIAGNDREFWQWHQARKLVAGDARRLLSWRTVTAFQLRPEDSLELVGAWERRADLRQVVWVLLTQALDTKPLPAGLIARARVVARGCGVADHVPELTPA